MNLGIDKYLGYAFSLETLNCILYKLDTRHALSSTFTQEYNVVVSEGMVFIVQRFTD
jgi:hypothetical protein